MKTRFFVLVEPFGPNDFTIQTDARKAERQVDDYLAAGKSVRLVETAGSLQDVRVTLRELAVAHTKADA